MRLAPIKLRNNFRQILEDEYTQRCKKNSQYSLRSFAKSMDIHPASLSLILRGKRECSQNMIDRLKEKLSLSPTQMATLVYQEEQDTTPSKREFINLSMDIFSICSEWYYDAILELTKLPEFDPNPKWISKVLELSINEVQIAISRLERVGHITIEDDTWTIHTQNSELFVNKFSSHALKNIQKNALEKSSKALDEVELDKRYHAGQVIAIKVADIAKAKELLRDFRNKFDYEITHNNPDDIYQLSVSFYPLTTLHKD